MSERVLIPYEELEDRFKSKSLRPSREPEGAMDFDELRIAQIAAQDAETKEIIDGVLRKTPNFFGVFEAILSGKSPTI
ncbi:MAG: hypothetical protein WC777_05700 [Candidatus Gracilibacteria bacterium]|jgi:hypothetical protein